jgi:hypothetical protein
MQQTSIQNSTNFNMVFLSRFKSQLAENLTAFLPRQPPLIYTASASPPVAVKLTAFLPRQPPLVYTASASPLKFFHGFVGG